MDVTAALPLPLASLLATGWLSPPELVGCPLPSLPQHHAYPLPAPCRGFIASSFQSRHEPCRSAPLPSAVMSPALSIVLVFLLYRGSPPPRCSSSSFDAHCPGFIPCKGALKVSNGGLPGKPQRMLRTRGATGLSSPSTQARGAAGAVQRRWGGLSPCPALAQRAAWKAGLEWEKYQHIFIFSSTSTDHCILIRALLPFHLGALAGDNCHSLVHAVQ